MTGAPADGDFGVGFFDPANPNNTVITTVNHHALLELEPGSFLVPTEIVISRKAGDPDLTNFDWSHLGLTYDYNAINSTNTHVLQPGKTANIAFCLVIIGGPETPGNGYPDPANWRIGHNPVVGAPGFPFEILEPFDLEGTELRKKWGCPGIDDVIGSAGGGSEPCQRGFAYPRPFPATLSRSGPPRWGRFRLRHPGVVRQGSLSPFKPVETSSNSIESFGSDLGPEDGNVVDQPLDACGDGCEPTYRIADGEVGIPGPTDLTATLTQGKARPEHSAARRSSRPRRQHPTPLFSMT